MFKNIKSKEGMPKDNLNDNAIIFNMKKIMPSVWAMKPVLHT